MFPVHVPDQVGLAAFVMQGRSAVVRSSGVPDIDALLPIELFPGLQPEVTRQSLLIFSRRAEKTGRYPVDTLIGDSPANQTPSG